MLILRPKISSDSILEAGRQIGIKIPESVLVDLLLVYENGSEDMLNHLQNSFICDFDGNFWTTWEKVFEIRSRIRKCKNQEILFRKFDKETLA